MYTSELWDSRAARTASAYSLRRVGCSASIIYRPFFHHDDRRCCISTKYAAVLFVIEPFFAYFSIMGDGGWFYVPKVSGISWRSSIKRHRVMQAHIMGRTFWISIPELYSSCVCFWMKYDPFIHRILISSLIFLKPNFNRSGLLMEAGGWIRPSGSAIPG